MTGQRSPSMRRRAVALTAAAVGSALAALGALGSPTEARAAMVTLPVGTERQQLPLDCEATSLTLALRAIGIATTQRAVQASFPVDVRSPVVDASGLPVRWGDPYTAFVGHVEGSEPGNSGFSSYPGWGAYAPVVAGAARAHGAAADARSGWAPADLYTAVERGHPVVVWTTVQSSDQVPRTWAAWDGRTVPWSQHGHVVVLMGVDRAAARVELSDPLSGGYRTASMAQLERTMAYYGNMAVVLLGRASGPPAAARVAPRSAPTAAPPRVAPPAATPAPAVLDPAASLGPATTRGPGDLGIVPLTMPATRDAAQPADGGSPLDAAAGAAVVGLAVMAGVAVARGRRGHRRAQGGTPTR